MHGKTTDTWRECDQIVTAPPPNQAHLETTAAQLAMKITSKIMSVH